MTVQSPFFTHGIRDQFRIAEFRAEPGTKIRGHSHDCWHVFVLKTGAFEEADERGDGVSMRPGTVRISPPGARHDIDYDERASNCLVLHLRDGALADTLCDRAGSGNAFVANHDLYGALLELCEQVKDPGRHFSSPLLIRRWLTGAAAIVVRGEFVPPPEWLLEAHDAISDSDEKTSIEKISKRFSVSREHLARGFKKYFGYSPSALRQRRLLDKAVALRLDEGAPLCEASLAAGFFDQSHFTNAFTRAAGVSPKRFFSATDA